MRTRLLAALALLVVACSKPGFARDAASDVRDEDASDTATEPPCVETDAATPDAAHTDADSPGACLFVHDAGVECEHRSRADCPVLPAGTQAFYGEGSACPSTEILYEWTGCECDADLNDDGNLDLTDIDAVGACQGPPHADCASADINHDGVVDEWDACIVLLAFAGDPQPCSGLNCGACLTVAGHGSCTVRNGTDCAGGLFLGTLTRCPACRCEGDLTRDGMVDVDDLNLSSSCAEDPGAPGCESGDVNCDGSVDSCDSAAVQCLFAEGEPGCCLVSCAPS